MTFSKICSDIRSLKIQGAVAVAMQGAKALEEFSKEIKTENPSKALKEIKKASKKIIATRPTEPALRNAMAFYFRRLNTRTKKDMVSHIDLKYHQIINHFENSRKKIIEYGVRKIKKGMVVYTHCHSSTVCDILIAAKKKKIRFEVHNTETRPLYQGRKTAEQLAKAGIKVTHYVDSAARHAIKKADIVLLGTDAITTTKVYNKIGSETIAMIAQDYDIPVYFFSDSWKFDYDSVFGFDEEIEKRLAKEVWPKSPKGINIYNYAFDKISPRFVTGIISDIGVFSHDIFVDEVLKGSEK